MWFKGKSKSLFEKGFNFLKKGVMWGIKNPDKVKKYVEKVKEGVNVARALFGDAREQIRTKGIKGVAMEAGRYALENPQEIKKKYEEAQQLAMRARQEADELRSLYRQIGQQ